MYPCWLAALGVCAIPVILSSRLIFSLNFAFPASKTSNSSIYHHVNTVEASAFFLIKAVTSELQNPRCLLKIKNISFTALLIMNSYLCLPIAELLR